MIQAGTTGANNSGYISFFTDNAGTSAERMRIISNGNVGIGTTAPGGVSKLEVQRPARTTAFSAADGDTWHDLIVRNPTNSSNAASGIAFLMNNTYHKNAGAGIVAISGGSDYTASLAFVTRPYGAVAKERMRIASDGNVGIGTTAPKEKLHVAGSIMQGDVDTRPGGMITFSMTITEGTTTTFFNPSDLDGVWSGMIEMHAKGHNDTNRSSYQQLVFRYSNAFTALQSSNLNLTPTFSYVAGAGATQGMRVNFAGGGFGQTIDCVFRIMGSHNS